jgi:hypothetical protein
MDTLFIYTGATDLSAAAVTSAASVTPLVGPDDFRQLVLGTTEPLTVKFLSAASTYESWSDDPTYTVTASLGELTPDGLSLYAEATLDTAVADGKSGDLALTTVALVDAARFATSCRPRATAMQLVLQITVTDPAGARRAYAQLPLTLNFRVPSFTPTPSPSPEYLTLDEAAALFAPRGQGYNAQANSTGNTTVTPASTKSRHIEIVTFSGSARTSVVVLDTVGRTAGDTVVLRLELPATAAIVAEVRNATAAGTLLSSLTSDGSGDDFCAEYVFTGTAFALLRYQYPA